MEMLGLKMWEQNLGHFSISFPGNEKSFPVSKRGLSDLNSFILEKVRLTVLVWQVAARLRGVRQDRESSGDQCISSEIAYADG